jgi:hypothetical protein
MSAGLNQMGAALLAQHFITTVHVFHEFFCCFRTKKEDVLI